MARQRAKSFADLNWGARRAPQIAQTAFELSRVEAKLFRQAVADVTPLSHDRVHHEPIAAPVMRRKQMLELPALSPSLAEISLDRLLARGEDAGFLRTGLSRTLLKDLRRGRWPQQASLDLHGLSREQALRALDGFLAQSLFQGLRCLHIVHGQGWRSAGREPVLKYLTRHYLANRSGVLAYCPAPAHAGGAGAVLVLLRAKSRVDL